MDKRITIVEDDESIQDVLKLILKTAGYQTTSFFNGRSILSGNYERPDLFLLDRQLSGEDGLDICRYLKAEEQTKLIPVIMISANPQIAELSKEAGADGYIEKPFTVENLLETIRSHTRNRTEIA